MVPRPVVHWSPKYAKYLPHKFAFFLVKLLTVVQVKELIYCAFDAASTHLYVPGLRLHMVNVLKYGGTPEEILEVLEIAAQLSLHTAHVATPILQKLISGD